MDLIEFLITFGAGLALGFVAGGRPKRRASRRGSGAEGSLDEALAELERENPQAAQTLRQPAAVPVDAVPASLTPQQQEELKNCATPEARKERARRFVKDPDAADIIAALAAWHPTRRRAGVELKEKDYEEKLIRFLEKREHGFSGSIKKRPPAQWGSDDATEPGICQRG